MKTEVRRELSKSFRSHWINAFLELRYNKDLSDEENIKLFWDWAFHTTWEDVKKELAIKKLKGGIN